MISLPLLAVYPSPRFLRPVSEDAVLRQLLKSALALPATRAIDLDDPAARTLHAEIIRSKPLLQEIYGEWYSLLSAVVAVAERPVLELGSGGGFLRQFVPRLITSDVMPTGGADIVLDARGLPFPDGALDGIVMTNVFHHIPDPTAFLREASRTLAPGGVLALVEPWVSTWSRFVYAHLHHEPFEPDAVDWTFPEGGAMSGANGALPWIVFARDAARFASECPGLRIERIEPGWSFRYLLSGGVSMRCVIPVCAFPMAKKLEALLNRRSATWPMFALIVVRRVND